MPLTPSSSAADTLKPSSIPGPNDLVSWSPQDMLEITLSEPDDFLKVRETLTRIGIASRREEKTLFQSCMLLHKQGRYFIVHFKEMFMLDGKTADFTYDDLCRRNAIALLLSDWGLLTIVNSAAIRTVLGAVQSPLRHIKIISHKEKSSWKLVPKYQIGHVKKKPV